MISEELHDFIGLNYDTSGPDAGLKGLMADVIAYSRQNDIDHDQALLDAEIDRNIEDEKSEPVPVDCEVCSKTFMPSTKNPGRSICADWACLAAGED